MKSAHWFTIDSNNYTTISNNTVTVLLWGIEMLSFWADIFNGKKIANGPKKYLQWPQKGSQSVQKPQILIAVIQGSRLMPILREFAWFLKKAGGFAGPPALQWVYSILAFCRGQGKRRAPAVQTLIPPPLPPLNFVRILQFCTVL